MCVYEIAGGGAGGVVHMRRKSLCSDLLGGRAGFLLALRIDGAKQWHVIEWLF